LKASDFLATGLTLTNNDDAESPELELFIVVLFVEIRQAGEASLALM